MSFRIHGAQNSNSIEYQLVLFFFDNFHDKIIIRASAKNFEKIKCLFKIANLLITQFKNQDCVEF